ncbi:MAG: beta-ketoacyl-[acyl-carrier-protein] synthase family protein [Planctomycetes bacterium]|jgi:3-oxoacyl-[acyl-carrier-protein] synthase II|nr:beta-ketoacyl-[acyl-carrier-protein] synthase family protein [Planctomycetota bacterium]
MPAAKRRVVLTGIGVVSSIGLDAASFWDGLANGRTGIKTIQAFDPSPLPTRFAGEILGFDVKKHLATKEERKQIRVMSRTIQLAVAAANLALIDSKVDKKKLVPSRFGVEFGAGLIPSELDELGAASYASTEGNAHAVDLKLWGQQGIESIQPLWMLKYLPNMLACHVSILHNAQGPNNSITESDVASLLALGEAVRVIQRDQADFFLVGGADSKLTPLSMVRQTLFGQLSRGNDAPDQAVKPFDLRRDGMIFGEGSGVLVAEELEHAKGRGATIYGEIVGFGASFDRGLTGKGMARAMRIALAQAGVSPGDIDHVNAHGLGSIKLDAAEARGIHEVFGASVPVWSLKSSIGSLGAGAGTAEVGASLLAFRHGTLPPTRNFETPDPACPVQVLTKPRPIAKAHFLKLGFTEMGQCAAVVCRKWD